MNTVDIIVLVILAVTCIFGITKGFFKTFLDTLGIIIVFFVAKQYYTYAKDFLLENTKIYSALNGYLSDRFTQFSKNLPTDNFELSNIFDGFGKLPIGIQNALNDVFNIEAAVDGSNALVNLSNNVADLIVTVISFLIVMLLSYIVLLIIITIVDRIFKAPVLNAINRLFGGIFGLAKGIVILYILFAIASPFIAFSDNNVFVNELLESKSSEYFYEKNVILSYLSYKGII